MEKEKKIIWTKQEVEELCRKAMIQGSVNSTPTQSCMLEKMCIKDFILKYIK